MLEFEYFTSLRNLIEYANKEGITAKEFVQVIPAQGITGYYLVYQRKSSKKDV